MHTVITENGVTQMTNEEFADYQRKLTRKVVRNILIFTAVKFAIFYGVNRAARSMRESN